MPEFGIDKGCFCCKKRKSCKHIDHWTDDDLIEIKHDTLEGDYRIGCDCDDFGKGISILREVVVFT